MNNETSKSIASILMSIFLVIAAIICCVIINRDEGDSTAIVCFLGFYIGYRVRDSLT